MALSSQDVSAIVADELQQFNSETTREEFLRLVCPPYLEERTWDWNRNQTVAVWVVAKRDDALIVYSRDGYDSPWGWVSTADQLLGMDAQWHSSLEFAFVGSRVRLGSAGFPVSVRRAHAHSSNHRSELFG